MYSSVTDIKRLISEATLLQLCDDDNVGAIVESPSNTAYLNIVAAIEQADALINTYIGGRYTVPVTLDPLPQILRDASGNLAVCNLFDRRREMDVPEGVERRRKSILQVLKDIAAGTAEIAELSSASSASILTNKTAADRMFTDTLLNRF